MTNLDALAQASLLRRLPSMKALLFFNVVGRHLNLVRAGEELHLTQGALSRQIKLLEQHLGVALFRRLARGLAFTQEGETLYAYSQQAFGTLDAGLRRRCRWWRAGRRWWCRWRAASRCACWPAGCRASCGRTPGWTCRSTRTATSPTWKPRAPTSPSGLPTAISKPAIAIAG